MCALRRCCANWTRARLRSRSRTGCPWMWWAASVLAVSDQAQYAAKMPLYLLYQTKHRMQQRWDRGVPGRLSLTLIVEPLGCGGRVRLRHDAAVQTSGGGASALAKEGSLPAAKQEASAAVKEEQGADAAREVRAEQADTKACNGSGQAAGQERPAKKARTGVCPSAQGCASCSIHM